MRRAKQQAIALRQIADRLDQGEGVSRELAVAIESELKARPEASEEVDAFAALEEGAPPEWHIEELERCDREDSGGDSWEVVRARILAGTSRRSA